MEVGWTGTWVRLRADRIVCATFGEKKDAGWKPALRSEGRKVPDGGSFGALRGFGAFIGINGGFGLCFQGEFRAVLDIDEILLIRQRIGSYPENCGK